MSEPDTTTPTSDTSLVEMTAELISAYVAKNSVPVAELPTLIRSVHGALEGLGRPEPAVVVAESLKPAVPIKRSVTDDYIVSLEDGRKLKSMKRYLAGLGMTPADYRAKWGLDPSYPMVAPAYAAKRSELAKSLGLGRKAGQGASGAASDVDEPEPKPTAAEAPKRGRKGKKGV